MNLSNFVLAAKKIANGKERFCCYALNKDSVEFEVFNELFNPWESKNEHSILMPWWESVAPNKQRIARTLALLLAYEITKEKLNAR